MLPVNKTVLLLLTTLSVSKSHKVLKEDFKSPCSPPQFALNGTKTEQSEHRIKKEYSHVREVKFSGSIGPLGEKRLCKIKCIDGKWAGPLCSEQHDNGRYHPLFRNCKLDYINPHLVITFRNVSMQARLNIGISQHKPHNCPLYPPHKTRNTKRQSNEMALKTAGWEFPHGAKLQIRCSKIGMYKLLGTPSPKCQNGVWSTRLPSCVPTTLLTNFTEDSPPSILVRMPAGSASVEPGGEYAVFPGSTIHFECLFSRRFGAPDWTWTSPLGEYLTGWAIAPEERDWKYRLSIYYAKPQDSGTFTCATPRGITNSITLHVAAVHCEPIAVHGMHLSVRVEGTRLGHNAIFQCPLGFRVDGAANLTCQASGEWSSPVPKCELVKCPQLDVPDGLDEPHLQLEEYNNSYGGRAIFSCAWGYQLMGSPGIECELPGKWSGPLPKCVPIQCPPPAIPLNGHLIQSEAPGMDGGRYAVGSLVQFACTDDHQLEGEASIICTETGVWSHPPPFCK